MTETSEQLLTRLRHDIDAACTDGPNPEWHIYDVTKRHAFKAAATEMILLAQKLGIWEDCKKKLTESNIEVIEKRN